MTAQDKFKRIIYSWSESMDDYEANYDELISVSVEKHKYPESIDHLNDFDIEFDKLLDMMKKQGLELKE